MAKIVCLGGGHGLFQTLTAFRLKGEKDITAVVSVADDGGSSGRIRKELEQIPPGDLRMAIAALTPDRENVGSVPWEDLLQHRFGGHGALAGHAVGNLLIAAFTEMLRSSVAALDTVVKAVGAVGRVLPVSCQPLQIEADVSGLDHTNIGNIYPVRGQVAVASTTGAVQRVRLIPQNPRPCAETMEAIRRADIITLGPGSWFTSVIPDVLIPGIEQAINDSSAVTVVVLNLSAEPGETAGFTAERHLYALKRHSQRLHVDYFLVDQNMVNSEKEQRELVISASDFGATILFRDLCEKDEFGTPTDRHDPELLGEALDEVQRAVRS
ncbi:gluconeogenesis factor YvcK family protein [Corynebacterium glucuronolyticum]